MPRYKHAKREKIEEEVIVPKYVQQRYMTRRKHPRIMMSSPARVNPALKMGYWTWDRDNEQECQRYRLAVDATIYLIGWLNMFSHSRSIMRFPGQEFAFQILLGTWKTKPIFMSVSCSPTTLESFNVCEGALWQNGITITIPELGYPSCPRAKVFRTEYELFRELNNLASVFQ